MDIKKNTLDEERLMKIHMSDGMTAEKFLETVPEQYKQEVILTIFEITQRNLPMNIVEIQSLVRERYNQKNLKD